MIKNLVLALALANFLVFAWYRWVEDIPSPPASGEREVSGTRLVSLNGGGSQTMDEAGGPAADRPRCIRVGPLASGSAADALEARLSGDWAGRLDGNGPAILRETEQGSVWVGYWVRLEPVAERAAADRAAAQLVRAGISDAYVLPADGGYTVSIGIFRNRELADRQARIARSAGLVAEISDRFREGTEHWLTVRLAAGAPVADLARLRLPGAHILRKIEVPCAPIADAGDAA